MPTPLSCQLHLLSFLTLLNALPLPPRTPHTSHHSSLPLTYNLTPPSHYSFPVFTHSPAIRVTHLAVLDNAGHVILDG